MSKQEHVVTDEREERWMGVKRRPKLVACYRLADVIRPELLAPLRPYLRATWAETWAEIGRSPDASVFDIDAIAMTVSLPQVAPRSMYSAGHIYRWPAWGREIERRLYEKALRLGCTPVMYRGRR
jgi:hypothetical protein